MAALEQEAKDVRKLLEETSSALEMIRLEAGRALPGYTAILSPATEAVEPADDSSKLLAAAGLGAGAGLPFAMALVLGLVSGRIRHSDALIRFSHRVPVLRVTPRREPGASEADRLRNALLLHPLRQPHPAGTARVITFLRLDGGAPADHALALARSFSTSGARVLLIDADLIGAGITRELGLAAAHGWLELVGGETPQPVQVSETLAVLPVGHAIDGAEARTGIAAVRKALAAVTADWDVVLICAPCPGENLITELLLSASDLGLAEVRPHDRKAKVARHVLRLDSLPRQGGGLVFAGARSGDPGLHA